MGQGGGEREREGERGRERDVLFPLLMHSLVASCMCLTGGINLATLAYGDKVLTN